MSSAVAKSLSRLSRDKILDLCTNWAKSSHCEPYLTTNRDIREIDEEDYLHEPATSRSDLRRIYASQKENARPPVGDENWNKKDLIDRIVDGDWRRGLSYEQLASIDFAVLEENDTALRWSALKLVPLTQNPEDVNNGDRRDQHRPLKRRRLDKDATPTTTSKSPPHRYPQITAAEFTRNLKTHISPLVKAHSHTQRIAAHNLSIVRLCIVPHTPFAPLDTNIPRDEKKALEGSNVLFIALPDSCPYVYVSMSGGTVLDRSRGKSGHNGKTGRPKVDTAAMKKIVLEAIPKAFSRSQQRWSLQSTKLTAKSLKALVLLRGNCRPGTSGGMFSGLSASVISDDSQQTALCDDDDDDDDDDGMSRREKEKNRLSLRERTIEQRFGPMTGEQRAKLDRVQFKVKDLLLQKARYGKKRKHGSEQEERRHQCDKEEDSAPMIITLSGSDVFSGLKQLAILYPDIVDLDRLPSAFTGEGSTSVVTL